MKYLSDIGQAYCTDPTNASTDPMRNRIRLRLLPWLEAEFSPQIARSLRRLADASRTDRAFIEAAAREHLEGCVASGATPSNTTAFGAGGSGPPSFDAAKIASAHPGLRPHVLRLACPVPVTSERMEALLSMLDAGAGHVQLEGNVDAQIGASGSLTFVPKKEAQLDESPRER